jgi:hypothetical protein
MKRILNLIRSFTKPKPVKPTIHTYGQSSCGLSPEQIQSVMEWLMGSLLHAGYFGESYLFWDWGDQNWSKIILIALLKKEPIFLYRCGDRPSPPPNHSYWRLIGEHPSLRIYQLEFKED